MRLLTSKMHLRGDSASRQREQALHAKLAEVAGHKINQTEIRVMLGAEEPLHDRFQLNDEKTWLLGSSLNLLGHRGTTAVRLGDVDQIRSDIEVEWERAVPLADFVAETSVQPE